MLAATENVCKTFTLPSGQVIHALSDVSVSIAEGELTILKGRSGSGKTTLMNTIGALDMPSSGKVLFLGEDITAYSEAKREDLRREKMGFIFQSVALIQMMSAYENIDFSLRLAGVKKDRDRMIKESLSLVGLSDRMDHLPQELSGGEQQRVAIARAIAHRPALILADEPTAELDTQTAGKVMNVFRKLVDEEKMTILLTTHDMGLLTFADRVYELSDGVLVSGKEKKEDRPDE